MHPVHVGQQSNLLLSGKSILPGKPGTNRQYRELRLGKAQRPKHRVEAALPMQKVAPEPEAGTLVGGAVGGRVPGGKRVRFRHCHRARTPFSSLPKLREALFECRGQLSAGTGTTEGPQKLPDAWRA